MGSARQNRGAIRVKNPFRPSVQITSRQAERTNPAVVVEPDIEEIRSQIANPDGLSIADFGPSYTRHSSEEIVWTPMDPSSLWSYVPPERRQLYIQRSSARLRRSGWVIADDDQRFLLDDLHAGYTVAEQRSFPGLLSSDRNSQKHYVVVCFNPRPDIAASIVGPPCPSDAR